jgi:hypothetical protein
MAALVPPIVDITTCGSPQISSVTTSGDGDKEIAGCIQPPKHKQQRMTESALQQKLGEEKRHKAEVHKVAVQLYTQEKEKPEGARMSSRQVQDHIQKKYGVGPSFRAIQRYAEEGLVKVSPKKMGPSGILLEGTYKLLCVALSSLITIHGKNARAGNNLRKKMITVLVKTMDMESREAGKLLDRLLRDTA